MGNFTPAMLSNAIDTRTDARQLGFSSTFRLHAGRMTGANDITPRRSLELGASSHVGGLREREHRVPHLFTDSLLGLHPCSSPLNHQPRLRATHRFYLPQNHTKPESKSVTFLLEQVITCAAALYLQRATTGRPTHP